MDSKKVGHPLVQPFHVYLIGKERLPIPSSFEEAALRLDRLPMLHFEPDGSFVWVRDGGLQQIFGMLYDGRGKIQYCELQGKCSKSIWIELRAAITGDVSTKQLAVMRLPEQQLQDLQSFERLAWISGDCSESEQPK